VKFEPTPWVAPIDPSRFARGIARFIAGAVRVPGLRRFLLLPVIARPGYWLATFVAFLWGCLLLGHWGRRRGLYSFIALPNWGFGRAGTTIGAIYLTNDTTRERVLEHEESPEALTGLSKIAMIDREYQRAFAREVDVWLRGCGLYIPLVAQVLIGYGFFQLRARGVAPWDESRGLVAVQRGNSLGQAALVVTAVIPPILILAILGFMAEAMKAERLAGGG